MESYAGAAGCQCRSVLLRRADAAHRPPDVHEIQVRDGAARPTSPSCHASSSVIDRWIEDRLLGGERPNAADLQIGGASACS